MIVINVSRSLQNVGKILNFEINCQITPGILIFLTVYPYENSVLLHTFSIIFCKVTNPANFKYKQYRASDVKLLGV